MAAASVKSAVSGTAGVAQPDPAHLGDSEKASATASVSGADSIDAEKQEVSPAEENPPRDVHGVRWFLVVIAILSSVFLFSLDNTVVADIQPAIVLEFDDVSKLPWLTGGFLLACLATTPIWGKLYGQLEAKWTYLFCLVLFEVGSALCGAAPNMNAMILGRVIAGLGGSGVYIGVMTLLSVTTTLEERPQYISYTGLIWGIGTVLGPIVGGAFTDSSAGWRWAFYINLVIGAVFAPVYLFFLPTHDMRPGVPFLNRFKEVDWVGAVLMIGAITAGIMAISFGGVLYAWNSGSIIACFVVSGVLFIILGFQQVYTIFTTESRRIFPIQFLKRKTMVILFAETSSASTAVGIPLYMIPLFFQFTQGDKALEAGVRILPYIALMVFACIVSGVLVSKFGYYMPWYLSGGLLVIIGGALLFADTDASSSASKIYGYSVLVGLGSGLFVQVSFAVAQGYSTPEEIPSAVGFITIAQTGGMAISIPIANAVFLNAAQDGLSVLLPNASFDEIQAAITGISGDFVQTLPESLKRPVLDVIVGALSKTYILTITAGALAVVLSLFMKREKMFLAGPVMGGA